MRASSSGSASTARAWPSVSSPRASIQSTSSGSSSSRSRFETPGFDRPDPLGHLAERELELVDERRVRARLLDGGKVLASDVLDEREEQRVAVVRLADEGG